MKTKKQFTSLPFMIAGIFLLFVTNSFSQVDLTEAQKYIDVPGGVQNVDKKVLEDPDPQFLPFLALKFRTGTSKTEQTGEGSDKVKATAYAVLDGIDSSMFQEITNEFHKSFIEKLKTAGVDFTDFDKIKATKGYEKYSVDQEERHYNNATFGTSDVFTPDNVPFFKYPANMMKILSWNSELGAMLSNLQLTVDFLEYDIDVDVKKEYDKWITTTTKSANAEVTAMVKIECVFREGTWETATVGSVFNTPGFVMSNKKGIFATFSNKPIFEPYKAVITSYDDKIPEFSTKKFRQFFGQMQLGTFVITVDPQDYKTAVLKALDRYSEYIVAIIQSYNIGKK